MKSNVIRLMAAFFVLSIPVLAQTPQASSQLLLENDSVRVLGLAIPPGATFTGDAKSDAIVVQLQQETATFVPKGTPVVEKNASERESDAVLIEIKKHWDAAMRPCSEPMNCTRTTKMGGEAIAFSTTLFTNGFVSAIKHKVVSGGSLASSYYSAKGSDSILIVPFTDLKANLAGLDEELKPGRPYFSKATEVEMTGSNREVRWLVVRLHVPAQ